MATRGNTEPQTKTNLFYDPSRTPTMPTGVWKDCPLLEAIHDPFYLDYLEEQHNTYNAAATTGDYILTQATAGTAAISTTISGALTLNAGSTTTTQGPNVQRAKAMFIPAAGKDIWAEFRVQITSATLKFMTFIGLSEIDTTIIATSAVHPANLIGWSSVTGDGVLLFNNIKATVGATQASTTVVSGTTLNLGFRYNGTTDTITQYINGVQTGTAVATANIPKVALYPSLVIQSQGTDQPTLTSLGYRIAQISA